MNAGRTALVVGVALVVGSVAVAQTTRVSVDSSGAEGNRRSGFGGYGVPLLSIASDGHTVAFYSEASNLVASDTNLCGDIFVHDRSSGVTERISVDSSGVEANDISGSAGMSLSSDGRLAAFDSRASNLVSGDTNGYYDIFVHDRNLGTTERVSVSSSGAEGSWESYDPSISSDGRIVSFYSAAWNLVAGDGNGTTDVFVHDRSTGVTELDSVDSSGVQGNDWSISPSITSDGQLVAFASRASNLVAGDTNGRIDVFVHDRSAGVTERVSVDSSGSEGNQDSGVYGVSISSDGQFVAFYSVASNLVAGDTNGWPDIFVHDRSTGITERVSVDSSGVEGNAVSYSPSISSGGRIVAFYSMASNLVVGDSNSAFDVFVHDRSTGLTERVSVDSSGAASGGGIGPEVSSSGGIVAFASTASDLVAGDTNGVCDVFVHESCGTTASWSNYGAGFPGSKGVPSFTAQSNPVLGATLTLDLANSYGNPTVGLLLIGFQSTIIPTNRGGDMLVVPSLVVPTTFSYGGNSYTGSIPDDFGLCDLIVDLQAIESDPGAAMGVSFTPGLELVLGL